MRYGWTAVLMASLLFGAMVRGAAAQEELKRLSIEELARIDVTSTARRPQPVQTTAAAISVITGEDIRRSGVTTIADALLLADGVHVARFNNGTWAISPRGFNATTANKLLVMVDGRTVYSPLFAGVFWNTEDYVLDDIDRIEVIRGPGAVLWGANAVNGVVNIITKHSRETKGALVSLATGNEDPYIGEFRYGGGIDTLTWRVYGKVAGREEQRFASGTASDDDRQRGQVGFRVDGTAARGTWLLKGDAFHSREGLFDRPDGEFTQLNLQGRWSAPVGRSRVEAQSYYRREYRRVPLQLTHHVDEFDLDVQQEITVRRRHEIVWGGGVRIIHDGTHPTAVLAFEPRQSTYSLSGVFVQDEISLLPNRLFVTLGAKYEHNAFSGGELQPNVRARYLMPHNQIVWGALSRAVRRPTRFDEDIRAFTPTGALLARGSDDFQPESLLAGEAGYRVQPTSVLSIDVSAFVHRIAQLRSQELPPTGPPIVTGNTLRGHARGIEMGVNVQPVDWWRSHVGVTWMETDIRRRPDSRDVGGGVTEANDPDALFGFRTALDLPHRIEIDAMLRAVTALPNPSVPGYAELNLRAGWRATPRTEVWVAGQDLLHARHPEFGLDLPARIEYERSVRIGLTLRTGP